jgi:uncharacterized membrane protein
MKDESWILASVSVLMAAILVIVLFLSALLGIENDWPVVRRHGNEIL